MLRCWQCVRTAVPAIEGVLTLQPDIVIMDVMMPEMNGIEAAFFLDNVASKQDSLHLVGDMIETSEKLS